MSDAADAAGGRAKGRVGSVIKGKWHIDARIGSGGMATVYAATHRNGSRAAIKMLHKQLSRDESTRARFLREGYVANAVGHPGVVQVLDDDVTEDGAAFLVLELLEGETLEARRLRLGGALPIDEALDLADQALDALGAAHDKGIVHRDLKPDNVFVTREGTVKLLDFGLARMKDAQGEATKTGVTIGTPEFIPPEQALGRRGEPDPRSDVWGLGATLFTAITGQYVHDAQNLHEQLMASATQRARPIRQLAPHVPPAVSLVLDRALELEMSDRWASAREMQAALRAARDARREGFAADSLTVPVSMPASAPVSSDKTIPMGKSGENAALPVSGRFDGTVKLPPASDPPFTPQPVTARISRPPALSSGPVPIAYAPSGGGPGAPSPPAQPVASAPRPAPDPVPSPLLSPRGDAPAPPPLEARSGARSAIVVSAVLIVLALAAGLAFLLRGRLG